LANQTVAITGGAGFIGSHLTDLLLARGNRIVILDDFSTGSKKNLKHLEKNSSLRVIENSVMNYEAIRTAFTDVNYVFHLATQNVRLSLRKPTTVHDVNTTGTYNVLKAASERRVKRFLYCSSSEVYGTAQEVPMREDYHFRPETIYGASKLTGEYYTQVFQRAGWLETVIARPFNSYGPREHYEGFKGEVIPRFILNAYAGKPLIIFGSGSQTRDFTYVPETAEYLLELMENDQSVGRTFNVCHGEEISIVEIAKLVIELTGSKSKIEYLSERPSDVLRLFGDASRLRELTGHQPRTAIREGMEKTVAWFKEHVAMNEETLASMEPQNWSKIAAEPWIRSK